MTKHTMHTAPSLFGPHEHSMPAKASEKVVETTKNDNEVRPRIDGSQSLFEPSSSAYLGASNHLTIKIPARDNGFDLLEDDDVEEEEAALKTSATLSAAKPGAMMRPMKISIPKKQDRATSMDYPVPMPPFLARGSSASSLTNAPFLARATSSGSSGSSLTSAPFLARAASGSSFMSTPFFARAASGSSFMSAPFFARAASGSSLMSAPEDRNAIDPSLLALGVDMSELPSDASVPPPLRFRISNPAQFMTQPLIDTPRTHSSVCSSHAYSNLSNIYTPSTASDLSRGPQLGIDGGYFSTGALMRDPVLEYAGSTKRDASPTMLQNPDDLPYMSYQQGGPEARLVPMEPTATEPGAAPHHSATESKVEVPPLKRAPLVDVAQNTSVSKKARPEESNLMIPSKPALSMSGKKKRPSLLSDIESDKPCSCSKSRCIKLYCECFQNGMLCGRSCLCHRCLNNGRNAGPEGERTKAIKKILQRRPDAFGGRPKIQEGCACKKTHCLKKYCACLAKGIFCEAANCYCEDCFNKEGLSNPTALLATQSNKAPKQNGRDDKGLAPEVLRETVAAALLHLEGATGASMPPGV